MPVCYVPTPSPAHRYAIVKILHSRHLAVVSHSQPSTLDVGKSHAARLFQTSNAQPIAHRGLANKAVDDLVLWAGESDRPNLTVVAVENINLAVARGFDGVARREVGAQSAAPAARRDGKGDIVIILIGGAGVLRDGVVDREADCFWVGHLTGLCGEVGGGGWGGRCKGDRAQKSGGDCEILHFGDGGVDEVVGRKALIGVFSWREGSSVVPWRNAGG